MRYLCFLCYVFITGCSTWLRYDYESALTSLPKDATVDKITNDYIEYHTTMGSYKAYYDVAGKIYKTNQIK